MGRFSDKCEQYFRINFGNKFNFQDFNLTMIKERVTECIVAFDPSYIDKSGKKTYGLGMYWSGCAGRTKRGLEICGFAAVDIALIRFSKKWIFLIAEIDFGCFSPSATA